jgi:hypothetical protein
MKSVKDGEKASSPLCTSSSTPVASVQSNIGDKIRYRQAVLASSMKVKSKGKGKAIPVTGHGGP